MFAKIDGEDDVSVLDQVQDNDTIAISGFNMATRSCLPSFSAF